MATDMSSILRELERVQDRLTSLPQDTETEKLMLLNRQEELRTRAARLAVEVDSQCSTQDLLGQLAALRRQLAAFDRQRSGGSSRPGAYRPNSPGRSTSRIEQKIMRIEGILADRGIGLR